jgi:hypothetical protein
MNLDDILNKIKIDDRESFRLNCPNNIYFPDFIIKALKEKFDHRIEKGGLILFNYSLLNNTITFSAKNVVFIKNISKTPNHQYAPDKKELKTAYDDAFSKNLLPLAFHTHPTVYKDSDNIINEGMHYLQQLNTSIEDKGYTLRENYKYKGVNLRLPDILVVENANAVFVGIYGGLIAPMCFTEQKDKATMTGMENVFSGLTKWANTPERKAVVLFCSFALVVLGIKYYKVSIPVLITAGAVIPPILYSNQKRCDFFGVSYGLELNIYIPKIDDFEIKEYENKAIEARLEAIKRIEAKKNIT